MPLSRRMTRFASYTGNHMVQLRFPVDQSGSAVTTEAVARLIAVNVAPRGFFQAWRRIENVSNGPVQPVNCRVVAHAAFSEPSTTAEHIGLGEVGITEHIKDRLTEGFFPVSHTIDALLAVAYDLIGKLPSLDRKSTRLNSSHRTISYAVF